jgi:hypothetical protein
MVTHAKESRKPLNRPARGGKRAYCANGIVAEDGGAILGSPPVALTALGNPISDVIGVAAKPQMLRVHARRIVAAMKDVRAFGDISDKHAVCDSVRGSNDAVETRLSISLGTAGAGPFPAFRWVSNGRPSSDCSFVPNDTFHDVTYFTDSRPGSQDGSSY